MATSMRKPPDSLIILTVFLLLSIGVVIVHSASSVLSLQKFGDSYFFATRQLIFAVLGIVMMFIMMQVDYWRLKKYAGLILLICFLALVAVLIPGVGVVRNGSRAWLGLASFGIQPSELAKLGILIFLADYLERNQAVIQDFRKGVLIPLSVVVAAIGLIMLEPDLGQSTVIMATAVIVIYAAGARLVHLGGLASLSIPAFGALVAIAPYRLQRIFAFLDPWSDPLGAGYHVIQSLYAMGPGGLLGLGLGHSRQKFLYLPEPQTDFVFAILSEELGFIGGATVLLLFLCLVWRGIRTAMAAPDTFGALLAAGITGMIATQVAINIGVVTGSIPVTGITLPFISYGGSSLTLILTGVGILLNISRHAK